MATTYKHKRTATAGKVPAATDLLDGEIGINTTDGSVFTPKNVSGTRTIVSIFGGVVTADPTSPVVGMYWYRSDLKQWFAFDGTNTTIMTNVSCLDAISSTTYTVSATDEVVFFAGAGSDVTATLPLASSCPGKELVLWQFNTSHRLNIARQGSDIIAAFGTNTTWGIDPGFGLGVRLKSAGSVFGGGAWVVIGGYGLDIYWGQMNKLIPDAAGSNYSLVGTEFGMTSSSLPASVVFSLPATVSTFNKIWTMIYDSSGLASPTKKYTLSPNGSETINGVNANLDIITTPRGGGILQGDANGHWTWLPFPAPASVAPLMDGTAAIGVSPRYALEDHVHPSDTSRAKAGSGSTDPGTGQDSSQGYQVGSTYVQTTSKRFWTCSSASLGAAVWFKVPIIMGQLSGTGAKTITTVVANAPAGLYEGFINLVGKGTVSVTAKITYTDEFGNSDGWTIGAISFTTTGQSNGVIPPFALASTGNISITITINSGTGSNCDWDCAIKGI